MSDTDLALFPVEKRTALTQAAKAWTQIAEQVKSFIVVDDATAEHARKLAKQARDAYRAQEEERKTITTPLLSLKNTVDAMFKPTTEAILSIKKHYEQQIARYDLEREQARARVLAESAAQIAQNIVPTEPIPEPVAVAKTSVRHHWEPEIVDPDLVPREFCSPDAAKIRAAIWYADTPHKAPQDIPGVKFVLKSTVVVR